MPMMAITLHFFVTSSIHCSQRAPAFVMSESSSAKIDRLSSLSLPPFFEYLIFECLSFDDFFVVVVVVVVVVWTCYERKETGGCFT
jgi:hypothetical protein